MTQKRNTVNRVKAWALVLNGTVCEALTDYGDFLHIHRTRKEANRALSFILNDQWRVVPITYEKPKAGGKRRK